LFTLLDDWELRDFNFSRLWNPDLKPGHGPDESELYRLVFESRKGLSHAALELGDTMYWTLRAPTFESFQRLHGPRPIEYKDWFYSKLHQFLSILVYEELRVTRVKVGHRGSPTAQRRVVCARVSGYTDAQNYAGGNLRWFS
jgi:hypothetical protein